MCVGEKDLEAVCSCLKGAHTANSGEWQCISSHCRKLINRTEQTHPLCDALQAEQRPSSCFYGISKAQLDASPLRVCVCEQGRKYLNTLSPSVRDKVHWSSDSDGKGSQGWVAPLQKLLGFDS